MTTRSLLVSAHPRASKGIPLLEKGFRPFFLLGAAYSALAVPAWIAALLGGYAPGGALGGMQWHAHEMLFGFTVAIIAGFLLTAVANWTNRETATGVRLALLAALWAAGRVAVFFAERAPLPAALLDIAFLPALAVTCAIPIVATKNRRNYGFIALLALLATLNAAAHWAAVREDAAAVRAVHTVALDVILLVIVVVTGRVVPMFTRNATGVQAIHGVPLLESASRGSVALLTLSDALPRAEGRSAWFAALAAALLLARMWHWGSRHTLREPLLWVLHAGALWLPIGLGLRAAAELGFALPTTSALHALTAGAIGTLTLGMMARVSLGHTGRMLKAPRVMTIGFAAVMLAAIVRVAAAFMAAVYFPALELAALFWSLAFVLFLASYARILMTPRADAPPERRAVPLSKQIATATVVVGLTGFAPGCGEPPLSVPRVSEPDIALEEATDLDPSPGVLSVHLVAEPARAEIVPGRLTTVWSYSQSFPGPLMRARRGDRLIVEFENRLDEATTIHWHGVRVPNAMDGVPDHTQPLVLPGERFVYDFPLVDAGLFWYHPHYDTVAAVGAGLYGALLVEDPSDDRDVGDEVVLILSDITLDDDAAVVPPTHAAAALLVGHEGNTLLVNGRVRPMLEASPGRRQRWRIVNAARSRYFRLGAAGQHFTTIGGDGGRLEFPVPADDVSIVPGQRLDLVVEPVGEVGSTFEVMALPLSRGFTLPESAPEPLFSVRLVEDARPALPALPDTLRMPTAIDPSGAERVPIALTINEKETGIEMGIDGQPFAGGKAVHALVDTTQILSVSNQTAYSHPFHLHGYFFQELDEQGLPRRPLALEDTVDIPAFGTKNLVVRYDDRPGMWMFHCHILDHAEIGMMGAIHLTR